MTTNLILLPFQRQQRTRKHSTLRRCMKIVPPVCLIFSTLTLICSSILIIVIVPSTIYQQQHHHHHHHHHVANAFTAVTNCRTTKRTTTTRIRRNLSLDNFYHWDDIVYQTESLGNALASFSLPQPDFQSAPPLQQQQQPHDGTTGSHMILALPVMYLAGLLTSFSPCVWGLLPLTVSYISTAAQERSDQRTLIPTLAFAAGLASVFCTMGMITVFTVGTVFGGTSTAPSSTTLLNTNAMAFTTTMILPILSNSVCFIMGLKLLELIDIALPSLTFLDPQQLLSSASPSTTSNTRGRPILLDASGRQISSTTTANVAATSTIPTTTTGTNGGDETDERQNKDNNALFRTFLLGGSSALVASPCATPVLTSILAYVANTMAITESSSSGSTLLSTVASTLTGGFLLFGYTLGYSTPLLIVAATSGQALVRLKQQQQQNPELDTEQTQQQQQPILSFLYSIPNRIAPWVTPITGGILLYLGTTGLLVNLIGDPSLSGLAIIE